MSSDQTSHSPRISTLYAPVRSPVIASDTPPPPPPKPSSHEASRRSTPQTGPPQSLFIDDPQQYNTQMGLDLESKKHHDYGYDPDLRVSLPEPPGIEDRWLPEIVKAKSTTELQSLLSSPALISALSTLHPSYTASQQHLHTLLESNNALATHVLEVESHLASLRASTESLLLTHQSLEVSWRKKQTEMDTALAPWSPKALYQRLVTAIAEQEAICQAVEESFLENEHQHGRASDREVVEWVRRVRAEAAKLEARREARARWDERRVGGWR